MPWIYNPQIGLLEPVPASVPLIARYISQAAHGFTALRAVLWNGSTWVAASSAAASTLAQGIILYTMTNSFVLAIAGKAIVPAHGLTQGVTYYTTDTPGVIGVTHGTVTQAVLFVEDVNTLQIFPCANTVQGAAFTSLSVKVPALATATVFSCGGVGFVNGAHIIYVDGVQQVTTFVSSTELQCAVTLDTSLHTVYVSNTGTTRYFRAWTGSTTWNPGGNVTVNYTHVPGGGSGGAGGEGRDSNWDASAGGGGGYGAIQTGTVALTAQSYTIAIGNGQSGGAQQATQNTNGADGANGGDTTAFGVTATGGIKGAGGRANNSTGGGGVGGATGGGQGGSFTAPPSQLAGVDGNNATISPGGTAGTNEGGGGGAGRNADFLGPVTAGGVGGSGGSHNGGDGADTPAYVYGGGGPGGGSAVYTGSHSGKGGNSAGGLVYVSSTTAFA